MYFLLTSTALKSLNKTADHDHIRLSGKSDTEQLPFFAKSKASRENVHVNYLMKGNFV